MKDVGEMGWLLAGLLAVFASALTFVSVLFWRYRSRVALERSAELSRLSALESQVQIVATQMAPLWAAVEAKIAHDLIHGSPQFAEFAQLLRQLLDLSISMQKEHLKGVK